MFVARPLRGSRIVLVTVLVATAGCIGCGSSSPVAPTASGFQVVCPSTLLAGDIAVCHAGSSLAGSVNALWSSSDPAIASVNSFGVLVGHDAGQVTVSASYAGQSGSSAPVSVQLIDVVRVDSSLEPLGVSVGNSTLMQFGGFYGVASADSGQLSLVITDQNDSLIATSARTVSHGGDQFVLQSIFTVPVGTTQVCRKVVLQIGAATLTAVLSGGIKPCISVGL